MVCVTRCWYHFSLNAILKIPSGFPINCAMNCKLLLVGARFWSHNFGKNRRKKCGISWVFGMKRIMQLLISDIFLYINGHHVLTIDESKRKRKRKKKNIAWPKRENGLSDVLTITYEGYAFETINRINELLINGKIRHFSIILKAIDSYKWTPVRRIHLHLHFFLLEKAFLIHLVFLAERKLQLNVVKYFLGRFSGWRHVSVTAVMPIAKTRTTLRTVTFQMSHKIQSRICFHHVRRLSRHFANNKLPACAYRAPHNANTFPLQKEKYNQNWHWFLSHIEEFFVALCLQFRLYFGSVCWC